MFFEASGLKANLNKSQVYFGGVDNDTKEAIISLLGYEIGELPFKYLAVPLSNKKLTIAQCQPLVDKITARITSWMARGMSYAGRVQMIRSVLFGIQAYWSQVFLLPQKVIKLIEATCRSYLWTGEATISRRALVAWEKQYANYYGLSVNERKSYGSPGCTHTTSRTKDWLTMEPPREASWMIRKIFHMRKFWPMLASQQQLLDRGKFQIKCAYKMLRGAVTLVPWRGLVCHNVACPKHVFILWLALLGRMRTKDLLLKWGMGINGTCVLCNNQPETIEHLYFECTYSHEIWLRVLQ
ncbi:uncharacterized protein LOC132066268 [Lycium ferocissimum]|uniref:uncharacterized protein LOC132066268 n=1 Tax=Lycium ferocissimum TaxID=112874 RepID=UPI0028167F95|nr:uncharacterized protein LOC132066268 [Lycium ferocissimum]